MSDTWSSTPPTEPGRYWRVQRYECQRCWADPEEVVVLGPGKTITDTFWHRLDEPESEARVAIRNAWTLWGPKIEDPEPPEVPQ